MNTIPVRSVKLPFAYLLKVSDPEISELLRTHGIKNGKAFGGFGY